MTFSPETGNSHACKGNANKKSNRDKPRTKTLVRDIQIIGSVPRVYLIETLLEIWKSGINSINH